MSSLRKLFKIHAGEASKVIHFALLAAFLEAGVALAISTADALFLVHVGAEKLPVVFILLPLIMLAFAPLQSYLGTRYGVDWLFRITLSVLVVGGPIWLLVVSSLGSTVTWPHYVTKLYTALWSISLFTLFWNYVDRYFDILDAKRLFSVFSGGAACGAIFGGALVTVLVHSVQVERLFLVWSALALLTFPVLFRINKKWRKIESDSEPEQAGFYQQTAEITGAMKRSRYVLLLNLILMTGVFLATVCEYQYLKIFSETTSKEELAVLFGTLFAVTNLFNLAINFFFFSRMVVLLGVRNVALIQPLVYLLAFWFLYQDPVWQAAVVAFFAYQGIQNSVDNNNWNFLMNAVPARVKSQVRTFTEGISEPAAVSCAGICLFVFAPRLTEAQISAVGLGGCLLFILVAVLVRHDYLGAMVANLKKEWLDFSRSEEQILSGLDDRELQELARRAESTNPGAACAAIRILSINDRNAALDSLLSFSARAGEGHRAAIHDLLDGILKGAETELLLRLVRCLEGNDLISHPTFVEVLGSRGLVPSEILESMISSTDPRERAAAAVAQWHSWNPMVSQKAISVINDLLSKKSGERRVGIRAVGLLGQEKYAHFLARFLEDPSPEIRCEALDAIRTLANGDSGHLLPSILGVLQNGGNSLERTRAIGVLSRIRDSDCILPLLSQNRRLTPSERRQVEKLILDIGLRSVPTVVTVLRDPSFDYAARSIAARVLGKLAFPQLEALLPELIETELRRAYRYLYFHSVLEECRPATTGVAVLSRFFKDVQQASLEFVLEILTIGGRLTDFELISSSLRSKNPKVRGNAIEAVEQACDRQVFKLLVPLVDSRNRLETVNFYLRNFKSQAINADGVIEEALNGPFDLECSAAAQATWEVRPEESMQLFREKLRRKNSKLFREIILSLLRRAQGVTTLNTVEKIHRLSRVPLFGKFGSFELLSFARLAEVVEYPDGQLVYRSGDPADRLFVVLAGYARLEEGQICRRADSIFGEGSLFGQRERSEEAKSEGLTALAVDSERILDLATRHPKIAIGFLETRLEMP